MKTAKRVIRVLVLLLTSVWGVFFGIIGSLAVMTGDTPISSHYIMKVWFAAAVIGYFVPCFLIMLDLSKSAAAFAVAGTGMTLFVHLIISEYFTGSFMYLPQIFITILAILYVFIINPEYITGANEKRKAKLNAPAPSILDKNERI